MWLNDNNMRTKETVHGLIAMKRKGVGQQMEGRQHAREILVLAGSQVARGGG